MRLSDVIDEGTKLIETHFGENQCTAFREMDFLA
uniref:Transposase n=1 Tax=Taenia asiatica TaxID=60517 RepID=A0A0R3W7L3_TAEAS